MEQDIGLIGFGEAGYTFAAAGKWGDGLRVFDLKADDPQHGGGMRERYATIGAFGSPSLETMLGGVRVVISLVTADQALVVAQQAARTLGAGALYLDLNSVAPQTKRAAARAIEAAGGHYVDVAVMAPVEPARLAVPLLLSGAQADDARDRLAMLGFANIRVVGESVGRASAIKMIRSVMVKGMEALTAECLLAAEAAGVREEVLASLDASEKTQPWETRADYNLDRMLHHGLRRAAEMEEVVKTLDDLGTGAAMSRGTVERQRAIGALEVDAPPSGLAAKIHRITANNEKADAA